MFTTWIDQREPVTVDCGPGRTKQAMKEECDINVIMRKYKKTGLVNFVSARQAEYMEVPQIDFHQAMNIVVKAEQMFEEMPAHMRKKFNNDPGAFLDFVHDPMNNEEMYEMGLKKRPRGEAVAAANEPVAPESPSESETA